MKDEIKEIVVDNDELIAYYKDGSFQTFDTLSKEVLDYITNLQEENKKLKKQYAKEEKKLFHDNEILQQRIDKTIKHIKKKIPYWKEWHYDMVIDTEDMNEIISLLKGEE